MNEKANFFLRTILSATIEDRETFIRKFGKVLEDYAGMEAGKSQKAGEHIVKGLTALRNELQAESLRQACSTGPETQTSSRKPDSSGNAEILQALEKIQAEILALKARLETEPPRQP